MNDPSSTRTSTGTGSTADPADGMRAPGYMVRPAAKSDEIAVTGLMSDLIAPSTLRPGPGLSSRPPALF